MADFVRIAIKGGIAMAVAFFISFVTLPIMANIYASDSWKNSSATGIIARDNLMQIFQFFPVILAGLYIIYMVWSGFVNQPEEYQTSGTDW